MCFMCTAGLQVSVNKDMCETHDVKQNLQNETYQTVGEFVTDIEHIFQHCSSEGVSFTTVCTHKVFTICIFVCILF